VSDIVHISQKTFHSGVQPNTNVSADLQASLTMSIRAASDVCIADFCTRYDVGNDYDLQSVDSQSAPWFQHFDDVKTDCDLQHAEHRSAQPFLNTADVAGVHASPIIANRHTQESHHFDDVLNDGVVMTS